MLLSMGILLSGNTKVPTLHSIKCSSEGTELVILNIMKATSFKEESCVSVVFQLPFLIIRDGILSPPGFSSVSFRVPLRFYK